MIKALYEYFWKRGYSDDEIKEKIQNLLLNIEKVVVTDGMVAEEMIELLMNE